MKTHPRFPATSKDAYALLMVLLFGGVGMLALAGALSWTQTNGTLISRSNQNYRAAAAAEAATEMVLARLSRDFKNSGESTAYGNLDTYGGLVPTASDNALWADFTFSDGQGTSGRTYVSRTAASTYTTLDSQYSGLLGFASTYRIVSNARENNMRFDVPGAVQQEVQLASIPIFQFAIFYTGDMELNGASTLHVRGRVHGNSNFYLGSGSSQYFYEDVTVSGAIVYGSRYGWSTNGGTQYFYDTKETNRSALTLPIGTNNTASAVREVLQMPPSSEVIDSAMGRERYYNKAELVVLVSNSTVTVGVKDKFSGTLTSIPWLATTNFISTNITFTDKRENKTVQTTQIDVGRFSTWAATNSEVISVLGSGVKPDLIYVGNYKTETSSRINGVRLVNAQTLPERGLTVATPNPLYTKGHFNQPNSSYLGTTNTSNTKPASLAADAYTLLSGAFSDSASGNADPTTRVADNTTVVAALIAGNVPSGSTYSGGVNNLPRLLESWTGKTYTLNGSLVCLYNSAKATNQFQNPGIYYNAPTRNINFDQNLTDSTKLPPGTPAMRVLVRGKWVNPPPGTVSYSGL